MKKIALIFVIMLLAFSVAHAQWVIDEGFEGTWPPADWTIMSSSNISNEVVQSGDQAYSGSYSARFSSYYSGAPYDEYLITPEVLTVDGDQASFWYRGYSYGTESFCVGWSSTGTDVNTDFTWGPDISDASTTWQQYLKTDLPAGTKYVAIHYYSDYMYYLYVDEFKVGSVPPTQSDQFGWEDGFSTVLGYYGEASFENTTEQAYEGTHSLKYTDDSSDAPQAYIWWITGLTDGQTIDASFWVYDETDQASYPKGRIWGHYTSDPNDIDSYAGSAGGNADYSTIGWSQLSHSWVFDSDGGSRDGFVVEARCYSDATHNIIYVDDAEITVGSSTAIIHHPTPPTVDIVVEVTVDSWYGEASWNVWDYAAGSWYFGTNQTFTAAYETVIDTLPLPLGEHAVYCWDSYGDGGIGGSVWNGDILLNEWASTDYTSLGIYDFSVFVPAYGDLAGYVMDTVTKAPIMDALVTCGTYWTFSGADGYYEIDDILVSSIAGPYTVDCEAEGFNPATETDVIIETDLTTDLDFDLTAPTMDIDDTPISVLMLPNTINDDNTITIDNNGDGPLEWSATIPMPDRLEIEIPAYTGTPPVNTYRNSVELDDGANSGSTSWHNQPLREILRGSTAWFRGGEYSTYFYGTFDTDTPGDMTEILSPPAWSSYAGDFDAVHTDFFYMNCNTDYNIYTIDCATGDATLVGSTGLTSYFNGMACDKVSNIMYACTGTNLYTVDLGTGAATLIGPMGTSLLVNLACDGSGNLYGVDISDDCLWSIDKDTGVGTLIGATGFAANYAQSMAWDPQTDVLFWAAYGGGLNGNLRVIDRTTGSSAFVGDFEGGREVTVFAFPGGVDSWLTLDPTSGTIPAGGSEDVQITFDSNGILPGESLFGDIEFYSDPNVGTVAVPAEMTVYIPEGYVFEGFDDPDFPPFGWENVDSWNRYTNDPYSGDGYAHTSWYHKYDAILHTPRLILGDEDFISFYWINANLYDAKGEKIEGGDTLYVEVSNTYNNIVPVWETLVALSAEEEMTEYENVLVSIPAAYTGHSAKIRFRHRSLLNAISRGIGLDNIIMPPPYLPVNFSVDPEYQSDYDAQEVTVDYDVEITNEGVQADRYNISVLDSRTTKDVLLAEGFESAVPPVGWTQEFVSGTVNWIQATEGQYSNPPAAYEGTYLALFYNGSYDGFTTKLVTPEIAFSDSKDGELTFWHTQVVWAGDQDNLNVYYKNSPTGTWTLLESYTTDVSTWTQRTISLPNTSSTYYIAFEGVANYGYGVCIDDVQVTGTSGPGPGPGPTGWPVTVSVPYLELEPGESGSFVVSVAIPEDAVLDDENTSSVYIASREDVKVNETAVVKTTCHPKDPYEPNDLMVDSTPADFDFVSDGAQIYYNPDYRDKDIDIYTIDCLEGDIVWCAFELPVDETEFDGAIKLVDADSTELAYADSWAGGGSEYLQYRIPEDGTYYWILGKWDNVLEGKASKKTVIRGENTTFYTVTFDLIPSPEVEVEPLALTLGMIAGTGGTVSDELYISNIASDALAEDLNWDLEVQIPGVETLYHSGFDDAAYWTVSGGSNWSVVATSNAGGTPPEARFYWSPNTTALQRLISPVINTTGYTEANLTFKHYLDYYADGTTVGVATTSDGGTTWNTVWSTSPTANIGPETFAVTIDNADMGSDQLQLCWFFDGISFDIDNWYVDDVNLGVGSEWVSVSPVAGSIGQGTTQTVAVTCNGDARLDPGTYTADLVVHNDALLYGASDITVPLTFYISAEAGGLQGTVTFNGDPVPEVMVKAGNFVTYTDEYGYYEFDAIASGTYNIFFYKEGFAPHWAYDVYLNPGWIVNLDVELTFDGPAPEDLTATGIQEAVDIDWVKPQTGGGGGGTQVDYVLDDGTYENGWSINPGYESWLGNQFPTTDGGEIVSFEIYGDANAAAGGETVTLDVYDSDRNLVGTTDPFLIPADDWVTVPAANIPFTGDFYAMIHWNMNTSSTNYVGFDENGPNANAGWDWYMSGGTWQLLHVAAASTPGVFGIRATAMVRGRNIELAYDTYQLGKEPEVNFRQVDNSAFEKGQRVLDKTFAQSGHTVDTGNYEVSHYTFNGDTELGFKMPRDIILEGYNVYELTKGFVAYVEGENNTSFVDDIVAVGTEYTYWVTAVYDAGESGPSNTDTAIPLAPEGGYHETFDQNWTTTGWTTEGSPNNWTWAAGYAYLYWSPSVTNYDMSLISPVISLPPDPLDVYDIVVSMYIDDYSTDAGEVMEIWIIHDGGETMLFEWDLDTNDDWGVSGGTDWVYSDTGVYAGQDVQLKFRSHGGTTFNFNYWYVYDVVFGYAGVPPVYGALEGIVTDGNSVPLEGVAVTANPSDYNPVYTDEFGYYLIDPMATGFYDVQYYKEGYTEIWYYDVEITEGVTTELNVALGNPTMDITPTSIPDATVPVGGTSTRTITVTNNGNAPLDWGASINDQTDLLALMLANSYSGPVGISSNSEFDPDQPTYIPPKPSEDMWDILFSYDVDTPTGGQGIAGAGFGNGYFLVSEWGYASRNVFKFDVAGNYISSWVPTWMPGTAGLRDMAFDGTYFYASNAGTTIYQFDEDGNNYGTITSPVAVRSIAYDSDSDGFWVNNWSETLTLISRTGSVLNTIPTPPSMYGSAYDNVSAGGPYLWIFTGTTTGGGSQIEQYNLNTLTLTGVTHSVDGDFGVNSYIAGGLFASGDIVPGTWVLGGCAQGTPDLLFGYELGPYATWVLIDPTSGTVDPYGASEEVTVTFNAGSDPAGTIHTCNILFESPQGVPPVTVPVVLMVGDPEYGDLAGTVTAATGGAFIEGAEIIASDDADNTYVTYTDEYGFYEIIDMMVGYYTVECTADGFNYHVEVDVPITDGNVTTQNFALTAPCMGVDPTALNVTVPPGSTHTSYITIHNTGDGPMNFDVNLYDFGKTETDYGRFTCDDELISLKNNLVTGTSGFNAEPQNRDDVIIQYQSGYDDNGIGTGAAFDAMPAARFTSDELTPYYDLYSLTQVNLHIRSADFTLVELKVWEGGSFGNAGTEIYSQDITASVLIDQWTNVVLTTPIPLVSGNEYWIGYSIAATADHPCSVDAGPAVAGKGDWMYYSGSWIEISTAYALDYNWCIQGVISLGSAPWITVDPTFGTIAPGGSMPIAVMFDATELTLGEIKTADIEIIPTPDVGTVIVPVTLLVNYISSGETPVIETALYANFPNPMLNSTTFNFSLKSRSHVTFSLYNVKGQLVDVLVDEEIDPTPSYKVDWDGTANGKKLANGIYFYKLETGSKTFLKKMILMK